MSWLIDGAYGLLFFWVEWVPGGWYGINFIAGLILGALLGKAAVAALLAVGGALIFWRRDSSKEDDIWPDPDKPVRRSSQKPPKGKVTRTIFNGGLDKLFGRGK